MSFVEFYGLWPDRDEMYVCMCLFTALQLIASIHDKKGTYVHRITLKIK